MLVNLNHLDAQMWISPTGHGSSPYNDTIKCMRYRSNDTKSLKILTYIAASLLVVVIGGLVLLASQHKTTGPFPASVRKQASFALYYPTELPAGWDVDQHSIGGNSQAVTYGITSNKSTKFAVSIQAIPADFDFTVFKKKFFSTDEFTTKIGSALVGEVGNSLVASIRTNDNSWILINTSYQTSRAELTELVRAFVKTDD